MTNLSSPKAILLRKYILGSLFILLGTLIVLKATGGFKFAGILMLALGLFYASFRTVKFDDNFVYIGKKKYTFSQIIKLGFIEVNSYAFPYLIINENGKKRRILTDAGQTGLLRSFLAILFPSLDPLKNLKKFTELLQQSKQNE